MQEHRNDDEKANLYACCACCIILPSIAVLLRFLARRKIHAPFKADDYLVLSAVVDLSRRPNMKSGVTDNDQGAAHRDECLHYTCHLWWDGQTHHLRQKSCPLRKSSFESCILVGLLLTLSLLGVHCRRSLLCLRHHFDEALCTFPIPSLVSIKTTQNYFDSGSRASLGLLACTGHCGLRAVHSPIKSVESNRAWHMH